MRLPIRSRPRSLRFPLGQLGESITLGCCAHTAAPSVASMVMAAAAIQAFIRRELVGIIETSFLPFCLSGVRYDLSCAMPKAGRELDDLAKGASKLVRDFSSCAPLISCRQRTLAWDCRDFGVLALSAPGVSLEARPERFRSPLLRGDRQQRFVSMQPSSFSSLTGSSRTIMAHDMRKNQKSRSPYTWVMSYMDSAMRVPAHGFRVLRYAMMFSRFSAFGTLMNIVVP